MREFVSSALSLALVATSVSGFAPAMAQTEPGMGDLIGVRGSSLDGALEGRGYKLATSKGVAQMWWNSSTKKCVSVVVDNGRASSIESASAKDCGHSGGGNDAVAGVVAAAVAVGLIAALSGHHKDHDNYNNNARYNAEYERGYNDAMYGGHYANNDSEGYHSGYMAGEAERNNRRYANSNVARRLPGAAGNACIWKGESEWGVYPGSVSVVSSYVGSAGNWHVSLATGHWRAMCKVTPNGQVISFKAN